MGARLWLFFECARAVSPCASLPGEHRLRNMPWRHDQGDSSGTRSGFYDGQMSRLSPPEECIAGLRSMPLLSALFGKRESGDWLRISAHTNVAKTTKIVKREFVACPRFPA